MAANVSKLDSMDLTVQDIIITGNKVTKEEIILRQMKIKKGSKFTSEDYKSDLHRIYNLGLFNRVDILPVPVSDKYVVVEVVVQEKWYIYPMPIAGLDEGEWSKLWLGMNVSWANFRGRNESLFASFRILYNPSFRISYRVPWIGENLHMFTSYGMGYSRTRNESLQAQGISNGSTTYSSSDTNFDYYHFNTQVTAGKYLTENLNVFTNLSYNYLRVSQFYPGRTVSPTGKDKYLGIGFGLSFDSRDIREYATKGFYFLSDYTHYGLVDRTVSFSRYNVESESYIPVSFTNDYYITIASKIFTSLAMGSVIPIYDHMILGYSGNYVRGWRGLAYEGENEFTAFNEIRIPIIQPRYIKASQLPLLKGMPYIKNMDLKHGLYFTIIYDVGSVWYKDELIYDQRFLSGTGIGLDAILPFGYLVRAEWVMRIDDPLRSQFTLTLGAKF
jgi:outer membrane protein assembly factor BamA